jgi:hypothetical protein
VAEQQKFTFKLPRGYREDDLESIAEDVIEFIKDRSQAGFGVRRGKNYQFPEYSEAYRVNVKGGQRRVDLTLNDDMLNAIEILDIDGRQVTIGFQEGEDNDKAEGNQLGSYGRAPNPRKARKFLGLTVEEREAILAAYDRDE